MLSKILKIFLEIVFFLELTLNYLPGTLSQPPQLNRNTPITNYEVIFAWDQIDFAFNSSDKRAEAIEKGEFVQKNCIISALKVYGNRIFLTVPRWKRGIPATLTYVNLDWKEKSSVVNNTIDSGADLNQKSYNNYDYEPINPPLIPYPNWDMQKEADCSKLQFVHALEIDKYDRLWVADIGRVDALSQRKDFKGNCSAKLVIFDLKSDQVLRTVLLDEQFVSQGSNFMHSMAISCKSKDDCWAYIADSQDTKIITYQFETNRIWFVQHFMMRGDIQHSKRYNILGNDYGFDNHLHGMVISPAGSRENETIFFTSLNGLELYSLRTASIQKIFNVINATLNETDVTLVGKKLGMSDGIAIDGKGRIYFSNIQESSVRVWDSKNGSVKLMPSNQILLNSDEFEMEWPDSLSLDEKDTYLYAITNKLQAYFLKMISPEDLNFRIIRFKVGDIELP